MDRNGNQLRISGYGDDLYPDTRQHHSDTGEGAISELSHSEARDIGGIVLGPDVGSVQEDTASAE